MSHGESVTKGCGAFSLWLFWALDPWCLDLVVVIVGLHRKCAWGGGAQELILKMQMKRYQCDIVITAIEEGNQSSRAWGVTQRFTHAALGR